MYLVKFEDRKRKRDKTRRKYQSCWVSRRKKKASLSKQTIHAKVYVTYPVHEYLKYTYIYNI